MPAPRGVRLFMKLNGCLPRSGRCTPSATSHNAPLARRNQGMMLLRSSIRSNVAAAKFRRLSQPKKRYVSVVRSPHVHTRVDLPSARACVVAGDLRLGRSRRAEQRRVGLFPILTATPLISASPGRTMFVLSSTRGNAATAQARCMSQPARRYVTRGLLGSLPPRLRRLSIGCAKKWSGKSNVR